MVTRTLVLLSPLNDEKSGLENNYQSLSFDSIYYQTFGTPRLLAIFRRPIVLYSRVNREDAVQMKRGGEEEKKREGDILDIRLSRDLLLLFGHWDILVLTDRGPAA